MEIRDTAGLKPALPAACAQKVRCARRGTRLNFSLASRTDWTYKERPTCRKDTLTAEHERLSKLAARPGAGTNDNGAELAKLRGEAEALKKQTNDLRRTVAASQSSQPSHSLPGKTPHTPEYYQQMRQSAGSRPIEARDIGRAFGDYAFDHQNECPTSLDQLTPYLAKNNATLSGSNQYEIIYHGSLDQLTNLSWGSIAVVRDAQPWPGPEGTMMRTYGFPSGMSQMVIDNLQPWLSQHVIMAPPTSSSSQ